MSKRPTPPAGTDLDADVAALKTRLAAAQRARIRAEGERDAAKAAADAARDQLARDFGVHTVDEAKAMLARLEAELAAEVAAISAALDELGL